MNLYCLPEHPLEFYVVPWTSAAKYLYPYTVFLILSRYSRGVIPLHNHHDDRLVYFKFRLRRAGRAGDFIKSVCDNAYDVEADDELQHRLVFSN